MQKSEMYLPISFNNFTFLSKWFLRIDILRSIFNFNAITLLNFKLIFIDYVWREKALQKWNKKNKQTALSPYVSGVMKAWKAHEKLPCCSLRELFSRFLDITTPPTPNLLQHFASIATDEEDQRKLTLLSTVSKPWRVWSSNTSQLYRI